MALAAVFDVPGLVGVKLDRLSIVEADAETVVAGDPLHGRKIAVADAVFVRSELNPFAGRHLAQIFSVDGVFSARVRDAV